LHDFGWSDDEERATIEDAFYTRVFKLLRKEGMDMPGNLDLAIEVSKVLGGLYYYIPKMKSNIRDLREQYLVVLSQRTSWEGRSRHE
jgi:hypothetical protein